MGLDIKSLDVTANQCLIPSGGIFKEIDCKDKTFVDNLALVESYLEQFNQLTQLSGSRKLCLL